MLYRIHLLLLLCSLVQAVELQPGKTVSIAFPHLPRPLVGDVAQLQIRLPEGYRQDRSYPVFCWLSGGAGWPRATSRYVGDLPYICISMPLFKIRRNIGPYLLPEDLAINRHAQEVMLQRFDELVPNTDPTRSILGGFSNGAHCIALLSQSPEILGRYRGILLCDGGQHFRCHRSLHGKQELLIATGMQSPLFRRLEKLARRTGPRSAYTFFLPMPGIGHAGPEDEHLRTVQRWVGERIYDRTPPVGSSQR